MSRLDDMTSMALNQHLNDDSLTHKERLGKCCEALDERSKHVKKMLSAMTKDMDDDDDATSGVDADSDDAMKAIQHSLMTSLFGGLRLTDHLALPPAPRRVSPNDWTPLPA